MSNGHGYIVITNWEKYQHRDAVRTGPPLRWQRMHTNQLDDDDYQELTRSQRGLLHDLRMLVARVGNGRYKADIRSIGGALGYHDKHLKRDLDSLIQAGLVSISAGKLPAQCQQPASLDKGKTKDPGTDPGLSLPSVDKARAGKTRQHSAQDTDQNGADPPLSKRQAQALIRKAQAQLVHPVDPDEEEIT